MKRSKILAARFGDIPQIYDVLSDAHRRSRLSDYALNEKAAKALIMNAIQRHGGTTAGSQFVAVAGNGNGIDGFIIGILQPLYHVLEVLEATDVYWIAREGADPTAARRLLRSMHRWAGKSEKCVKIRQGNTDIITEANRSGLILERQGMACRGNIYEKDIRT